MLYLIESGNYIKIGFSKDLDSLKNRMITYKTHNPDIKLLGLCEGTEEDECNYHIKLDNYKLYNRAEWFKKEGLSLVINDFKFGDLVDKYNIYFSKRTINKSGDGYQQLVKDYYENFDSEYELEYPEFKEYKKYLTLSNLKTLGYNKDKALEEISKKKSIIAKMSKFECGKFYTNAEIKTILGVKATTIKDYFEYTETKVNGKKGYRLQSRKFQIIA